MCLKTNTPEIKIAKADILCYKYGQQKPFILRAPHQKFTYLVGVKTKKTALMVQPTLMPYRLVPDDDSWREVNQGYHSLLHLIDVVKEKGPWDSIGLFIIPKGAKYVEGINNSKLDQPAYVSSTIIYIGSPNSLTSKLILKWRSLWN